MVAPFLVDGSDGGPPPHGPLSSVVFREFEHVLDFADIIHDKTLYQKHEPDQSSRVVYPRLSEATNRQNIREYP
jgi:hypothetical protein